ncbi:protein kinase [Microbacterium enclense]|uniref:serine/threonine-protein kinase n=1 Tax=Microbacterium enclense TaxID=993073 RepID=UPI00203C76BE|nr:serine/threonine-protein kinase [Microbacterium enclense]MCM3615857.1 protein kinase [Microbacterium enclense]
MSHAPDLSLAHTGDILGGRYILRERLGAGGMGRVFRARDEVLARDVAIKIFHADGTDGPEPLRRMSEARALAALDHPSLVTLYDARLVGEDHVYLVMELIAGPSLQRRIEQQAIPSRELAGILADLAGALAVVHDAGIVHRDVKPSNVLLRPLHGAPREAEAVLADFGVAHLIDATRLTTPGTVIGTAAYLAPEQVRGEAPQAASDIYALGLLAIEALTRLHPFGTGSLQETLLARLARQPDVPGSLSPQWRALLVAMTAADATARPSAAEVARRAEALAEEEPTLVPDATARPSAAEVARRAEMLAEEEPTLVPDATARLAGWMTPTAPIAASTAAAASPAAAGTVPAGASTGAAGAVSAGASEALLAGATDGTASGQSGPVRDDQAAALSQDAATPRRPSARRPRRRGWAWVAASAGAALIVGGHLAAFSLGAAQDVTTDRAPASTPAPARNDSPPVADDTAVATPAPVATSAPVSSPSPVVETDATAQPSPDASTPAQPAQPAPVVVEPVVSRATGPSGGGETTSAGGSAANPAPPVPSAEATRSPGRGAPEGTGRPDSPGKSDDAGPGRGVGPSGKN